MAATSVAMGDAVRPWWGPGLEGVTLDPSPSERALSAPCTHAVLEATRWPGSAWALPGSARSGGHTALLGLIPGRGPEVDS